MSPKLNCPNERVANEMTGDEPLILLHEIFVDHQGALRGETLIYSLEERKLIYLTFFPLCSCHIGRC